MSDAAEPEIDVAEPALRWTGLLMWLGMLFACALSSIYLVVSIVQGTILGPIYSGIGQSLEPGDEQRIAGLALFLTFIAAASLLVAWVSVARAAQGLVEEAVNGPEVEGAGAPAAWLSFRRGSAMSTPTVAVGALGLTWAILLVTPAFLAYMRVLLQD